MIQMIEDIPVRNIEMYYCLRIQVRVYIHIDKLKICFHCYLYEVSVDQLQGIHEYNIENTSKTSACIL